MNILVLSHRIPFPPNKGEKIRTFHQVEYLSSKNHEITVLSPRDTEDDDQYAIQLTQKVGAAAQCFDKPSLLSSAALALLQNKPVSVTSFYSHSLQNELERRLSQDSIDVIICSSSSMAEYIFQSKCLNANSGKRPILIMDFMDLDSDKWRQYEAMKPFPLSLIYKRESRLLRKYEKRIHEQFEASLFISSNETELFLEDAPDLGKLHVIGNGIDLDFFKPSTTPKPDKGPILLFTGVMDYLPNEDAVCWFVEEAWETLKKRHPDAEFYIAGMSPSSRVEALSQYAGVHVTGFVDDIKPYFDKAHIFVAPFRLARGVQNKVLQAFACGLPTVTTESGCEGIQAEHQKHVLIANNISETLRAVDSLVENTALSKTLSQNSHKLIVDSFSWSGILTQLDELISAHSQNG